MKDVIKEIIKKQFIDNGYVDHNFSDAETGFRWWISGKSYKQFYADEFQQQKINFDE